MTERARLGPEHLAALSFADMKDLTMFVIFKTAAYEIMIIPEAQDGSSSVLPRDHRKKGIKAKYGNLIFIRHHEESTTFAELA